MRMPLKALLVAATAIAAPLAAEAADYVDNYVLSLEDIDLGEQRRLRLGDTWRVNYGFAPDMRPFHVDLVFTGNASIIGVLSHVRYGIGIPDHDYDEIRNTGVGTGRAGEGTIDGNYMTGPFSIIYTYLGGSLPNRTALVNFTGTLDIDPEPVAVPEIGARGALPALLLALGAVVVMSGRRKRAAPNSLA